jgi:hypothetical protein
MLYHYTVVLKEWCDVARDVLCRTTLSWHHIIGMRGKTHLCKQRKHSDCLMFIHSYYVSQITVMLSFPRTWFQYFRSTFLQIKKHCWTIVQWHWKWSNSNVTLVNERQQITWHHAQNVVSLRVLYKFVNFNSTLVICLKFVFIEMLEKIITYIVCWYMTLYQVLSDAWTNCITTRRWHD